MTLTFDELMLVCIVVFIAAAIGGALGGRGR